MQAPLVTNFGLGWPSARSSSSPAPLSLRSSAPTDDSFADGIVVEFTVKEVVGDSVLLGTFQTCSQEGRTFYTEALFKGTETANMANGSGFAPSYPLLVTGTEAYADAKGVVRNVRVVQRIDSKIVEAVESEVRKRFTDPEVAAKTAKIEAELAERRKLFAPRVWRLADGSPSVEAKLVEISDDGLSVTLEKLDGTRVVLSRKTLSPADFNYLRKAAAKLD